MNFGKLLDTWMQDKQFYALKRRTYQRYEEIIRTHIKPRLEKIDTSELSVMSTISFAFWGQTTKQ